MANLNSILIAFITGCFAMASGIFFILYCLEEPIYSTVLKKNASGIDSDTQIRRVLLVLQQLLTFRVPNVMAILIIGGTIGSVSRVAFYEFAPLPVLVLLSCMLILVSSGLFVRPAIKIFKNTSPEVSFDEIRVSLAPIVRLHRNIGFLIVVTLILQLASVAF